MRTEMDKYIETQMRKPIIQPNSGKLDDTFLLKTENPEPITNKTVIGFKLVRDFTENFYSISSGLYRYKTGRVLRKNSTYYRLYENTEYYCKDLVDKVTVFKSIEDLKRMCDIDELEIKERRFAVVEMTLGGNLIKLTSRSKTDKCEVYAGTEIIKIRKL